MTTLEVRLSTPERLAEVLELPVAAVGIGQEGCWTKLPDATDLRRSFDRIRAAGRDAVLVAPIAWPRTAELLVDRLRLVAADGPLTISVNDLGTALTLAADRPAGVTLVAGLALSRARAHSGVTGTAPPPPAVDTALLATLGDHGFTAAEIDTETSAEPGDERWQLRRLVDVTPVGYARSCPTARHHGTGPPGCQTLCDTPYTISAHQRWQLNHGHREPLPAGIIGPVLTVWGNAVYQPAADDPLASAATAGYQIVDARWHSPDQLAARVQELHLGLTVSTGH